MGALPVAKLHKKTRRAANTCTKPTADRGQEGEARAEVGRPELDPHRERRAALLHCRGGGLTTTAVKSLSRG